MATIEVKDEPEIRCYEFTFVKDNGEKSESVRVSWICIDELIAKHLSRYLEGKS